MKFRLLAGTHTEGNNFFQKIVKQEGPVVESTRDLVDVFGENKFTRIEVRPTSEMVDVEPESTPSVVNPPSAIETQETREPPRYTIEKAKGRGSRDKWIVWDTETEEKYDDERYTKTVAEGLAQDLNDSLEFGD